MDEELPDDYRHRHLSHLYPLFPGEEVRRGHPLSDACARAVDLRELGRGQRLGVGASVGDLRLAGTRRSRAGLPEHAGEGLSAAQSLYAAQRLAGHGRVAAHRHGACPAGCADGCGECDSGNAPATLRRGDWRCCRPARKSSAAEKFETGASQADASICAGTGRRGNSGRR